MTATALPTPAPVVADAACPICLTPTPPAYCPICLRHERRVPLEPVGRLWWHGPGERARACHATSFVALPTLPVAVVARRGEEP